MDNLQFAGKTDTGLRRKDNQDTFICQPIWSRNDIVLLAAIDGVGGLAGGDKAAAIARESISRYMESPKGDLLTMLREAVVFANNQIVEARKEDIRFSGMCCVLTAAVTDASAQRLCFVHVGDSRMYRFRSGELTKLTKDHSIVGMREDEGELTEAQAMQHPRRNEILREVGSVPRRLDDAEFMDYGETGFLPGDAILLCSDGLTDMITAAQMKTVLQGESPLEQKAAELIGLANAAGGNDNITVVLAASAGTAPLPASRRVRTEGFPETPAPDNAFTAPPRGRRRVKRTLVAGIIAALLLIAAAAAWYFYPFRNGAIPQAAGNDTAAAPGTDIGAISVQARRPDYIDSATRALQSVPLADRHLTIDPALDTLWISEPVSLDALQSITGGADRNTVISSRSSTVRNGPAIRLGDSAGKLEKRLLRGLTISGFDVGIEMPAHAHIQLQQLRFEGVKHTVVLRLPDSSGITKNIILP
jgi:serine/threonine protein phosphatase PrpC